MPKNVIESTLFWWKKITKQKSKYLFTNDKSQKVQGKLESFILHS